MIKSKGELRSLILGCARSIDLADCYGCNVHKLPCCFSWKSMHQKDLCMNICMQAKYKRTPLICLLYAYKSFHIQSTKEMSQESVHGCIVREKNDTCTQILIQKYNVLYAVCIIRYGLMDKPTVGFL